MGGVRKPKKEEGAPYEFGTEKINFTRPKDFFKDMLQRPTIMWKLWKKEKPEIFKIAREEIKQQRRQEKKKHAHGHHINGFGEFQSDKYPDLGPDKIVLSFHDPEAQMALLVFSASTSDWGLGQDVLRRLVDINTKKRSKRTKEKAD